MSDDFLTILTSTLQTLSMLAFSAIFNSKLLIDLAILSIKVSGSAILLKPQMFHRA